MQIKAKECRGNMCQKIVSCKDFLHKEVKEKLIPYQTQKDMMGMINIGYPHLVTTGMGSP